MPAYQKKTPMTRGESEGEVEERGAEKAVGGREDSEERERSAERSTERERHVVRGEESTERHESDGED